MNGITVMKPAALGLAALVLGMAPALWWAWSPARPVIERGFATRLSVPIVPFTLPPEVKTVRVIPLLRSGHVPVPEGEAQTRSPDWTKRSWP
jgi:hypothetical protein